jgi:hypothetical protein
MDFTDKCSILAGTVTSSNKIFITVMNDRLAEQRQQHAIPLVFNNGSWSIIDVEPVLPWLVAGIASIDRPIPCVVIVGWGGQVLIVKNHTCKREAILRKSTGYVSIVRSVASIDDSIYSTGMNRQVYKRTERNGWVEVDHDILYQGNEVGDALNAIDGFNNIEIYAAGSNGEIWYYDGEHWHKIASPTNVHMHSLCCASDGYVYIGGKLGILIKGRKDSFEILETDIGKTIWDIHYFKNKLYLLTSNGIYLHTDGAFEKIQDDILSCEDFLHFSSSNEHLWIFGSKRIIQYDGLSWSKCTLTLSADTDNAPVAGFFNDDVLLSGSDYLED